MVRHGHRITYSRDNSRSWTTCHGLLALVAAASLAWIVYGRLRAPLDETRPVAAVVAALACLGVGFLVGRHLPAVRRRRF